MDRSFHGENFFLIQHPNQPFPLLVSFNELFRHNLPPLVQQSEIFADGPDPLWRSLVRFSRAGKTYANDGL